MSPSILIYANCQGEELMLTGRYLQSFGDRVTFKWIPLHKVTQQDWARLYTPDFMQGVVAVWEQVEGGPETAHRGELRRRLPPGCEVVKFPPLSALFLWPFSGNDPRLAADPDRYPWSDAVGAMLAPESLPDDVLFEKYMRLTTERMPDLARRLRMDVTRWKATDALADIKVSEWVEQNFRTTRLFHTSGHITAAVSIYLFKQLLVRTRALPQAMTNAAWSEVDLLLRHHQGQDFECVPIHPGVAERLGLTYYDPNARYRWHAHEWTFKQYILNYIRWAPYLD